LREVTIKIGLERLDTQEGITIEALLDSGATGLVMSSEFARKKGFKLKKLERLMQVRNVDGSFNREGPIENTVEVNVYYMGHVERMEIDVIGGQKWGVILGMLWLARHNPEIDWKIGEVKMTRCLEECGKQWRPVQGKSGWEKQKEEETKEEAGRKREEKEKKKKQNKRRVVEVRKVVEEWEIWDEEEKAAKSEVEAKKLVPERFYKWIKVFGKKQSERMPTRKLWDHTIDVKEGFVPRKGKVYLLSREEREEVREFVKEQLRKGYIQPSKSPQTAPVFFVGKKDEKKRMVQDYRYLNEWTIKNNYPLPLISDVLENIGTKKLFTKMDLRWGYNNVRIKEGDEWKAAFTMPEGSFEPTIMFFGLTNSPATFQAMMNELLRDLINTGKVAVFIDDVIVGTETEKGHNELVAEVVKRLEENDLYVKPEKCKWKVKEVEFLGVVIGPEGIKMEEGKVKGVLEWPTPQGVKDVQKFLGLANYYCRFIEGFATVAKPLHDLVKKNKKWEWTEREEKAFKELKEKFTKEPVLAAPDIDKKMRMEVDASDYATGEVLSMECKDGLWRPVAFLSKSLNEMERNYEIHDKEMLAIIRGLEAWRHLLEGVQYKFKIWTDHKNLEYFMKAQKLNRRQARWALYLSQFDFTLKHVAGSKMGKADGLSRRADWKVGTDKDNENQIFIKDHWIRSMYEVVVEGPEVEVVEKIKKARNKDKDIVRVVEEMKRAGVKELRGNEWKIEGDLMLKERKVYVPKDEELRMEIIWLHHDVPAAGHGGR